MTGNVLWWLLSDLDCACVQELQRVDTGSDISTTVDGVLGACLLNNVRYMLE